MARVLRFHAVQVFPVAGNLAIVDPNVRDILWGALDERTGRLVSTTADGKIRANFDFAYPPVRYWNRTISFLPDR